MKNTMEIPQRLKTELPYNRIVPLLSIYPEKNIIQKDTFTPKVHCSTTCNTKCPFTEELVKRWHILYNDNYSAIKKECNNAICSNMDELTIVILSEVSQTKTNIVLYCLYEKQKNNGKNDPINKT